MKLKMRFDADDMKKFLIACVIIFYIVCIAIANLSTVTATGDFTGLNPLPALKSDMIATTLILYVIAIAALLISCKSYFFEFDKGFGITTEKKDSDGYSKWCDEKEMKKQLKLVHPEDFHSDHAGVALINDGKKIYVDDSEYHNLVIGSTGSGKTTAIIYPMIELLSKHGESMIITDPKGELYEKKSNMLRAKGYNIILLNFRDPLKGNAWNPLSLPYTLWKKGNQDKAIELLEDLAANILYDEGNKNADPFWEKTSADYFSGLSLGLFEDANEDQINLNSISMMTTVGEEKLGGSTYIKEYFSPKDPNSPAYVSASSTILAPSDTKMSILAVFKQKIKLFASRAKLSEMLSYSDFNIEDIGRKKTALFIIIQDEKKTYHSLVTILLKQIYETLIDVAQNNSGKLPVRTNFLLDEFANMPPLKDVTTMITAARSRLMRFTMIIQNFAQLNEVYGEQNAETIKGNCGNTIYLISTELRALEEISKMCGEIKVKTGKDEKEKEETRPLITISDLQKLKMNEVIIRRLRMAPFKTKLTPDYKMNWGRTYKKAELNEIPERIRREVKTFDVREFVKKQKQANNPFASTSPFGGMGGGFAHQNPFEMPNRNIFPGLFGSNEGGLASKETLTDTNSSDYYDRLIKNIDAKIAELEEEERKLDSEENKQNSAITSNKNNDNVLDFLAPVTQNLDTKKETLVEKTQDHVLKDMINQIDEEEFIQNPNQEFQEEKNDPESIDELISKIKEKSGVVKENIKPNMELKEETKYKEVSDDEFFDDFFDD